MALVNITAIVGAAGTATVHAVAHGLTNGQGAYIIGNSVSGFNNGPAGGWTNITRGDADHFTFASATTGTGTGGTVNRFLQSNGSNGGNWASNATWAGGTDYPGSSAGDTTCFQILPGDTVPVASTNTIQMACPNFAGNSIVGTAGGDPTISVATLIVNGSLTWSAAGGTDLDFHGNGVIQVGAAGTMGMENSFNWYGGDISCLNANGGLGSIQGNAANYGMNTIPSGIADPNRTINLRNPHYMQLKTFGGEALYNFGPNGPAAQTYGLNGTWLSETFDTIPNPVVGQTFNNITVASVKRQTIYANFIGLDAASSNNIITVSFGTSYDTITQNQSAPNGTSLPMAVPLLNGVPLLDGSGHPVPVQICNVGNLDGCWAAVVELPSSITTFPGLGVRTFADDGDGNWVVQDLVYQAGSGAVANGGGNPYLLIP